MDGLSFVTWLEITGPLFAVLLAGFTLLWTQQQAVARQLLELGRIVGRLEGSLSGLDASVERLGAEVKRLSERLEPRRSP